MRTADNPKFLSRRDLTKIFIAAAGAVALDKVATGIEKLPPDFWSSLPNLFSVISVTLSRRAFGQGAYRVLVPNLEKGYSAEALKGSNFEIFNFNTQFRLEINTTWGSETLEALVQKYKTDWKVEIEVVAREADIKAKTGSTGVRHMVMYNGDLRRYYTEMVTYDLVSKKANWYISTGDVFEIQAFALYAKADKIGDVDFVDRLMEFLARTDNGYLFGPSDPISSQAQADRTKYNGTSYGYGDGSSNIALFEWKL